ncbi:hypothetical protein [Synechococcus sp. A15-44]|uniref:hypothetical protein n=1 Tax=Synechococcus sp. A15-44 TaxID=1050646 RepID=UPI0018603FEF|nr:hypothetical protein [Synechococcus sp. A15-44]QNI65470.1 hypothetical protein SynA1544_02549 [Synechococcus sp. A15-44]
MADANGDGAPAGGELHQASRQPLTKAFREHFQVPRNARSIGDRITQRQHSDFIELFLAEAQGQVQAEAPAEPGRYGEQPRSQAGRHFIQTQVRTDVYLRVREVMERHNLSASGAVHHLLRERFGLPPLPPFDQQPISTDSPHG